MKYAIADTKNGVLKTYTALSTASFDYYILVQGTIETELRILNGTGPTRDQIEDKVKSFYRLIKIEESK